ncbi:hypothetical protein Nepgr_015993 [Nepenthes gracilis]|uniref:Uncharacterized protein n=1 Tax=Nepenthes gracilis TaxID=150966 RepID=A0AAD3SN23_NEPGR|nr:hypothetical protein Nepgr_015993 [Nepenthes gracilis]
MKARSSCDFHRVRTNFYGQFVDIVLLSSCEVIGVLWFSSLLFFFWDLLGSRTTVQRLLILCSVSLLKSTPPGSCSDFVLILLKSSSTGSCADLISCITFAISVARFSHSSPSSSCAEKVLIEEKRGTLRSGRKKGQI